MSKVNEWQSLIKKHIMANVVIRQDSPYSFYIPQANLFVSIVDKENTKKQVEEAKKNNLNLLQIYEWDTEEEILNIIQSRMSSHEFTEFRIEKSRSKIEYFTKDIFDLSLPIATFKKKRKSWYLYSILGCDLLKKVCEDFIKRYSPETIVYYLNLSKETYLKSVLIELGFSEKEKLKNVVYNPSPNIYVSTFKHSKSIITKSKVPQSERKNPTYTAGIQICKWTHNHTEST